MFMVHIKYFYALFWCFNVAYAWMFLEMFILLHMSKKAWTILNMLELFAWLIWRLKCLFQLYKHDWLLPIILMVLCFWCSHISSARFIAPNIVDFHFKCLYISIVVVLIVHDFVLFLNCPLSMHALSECLDVSYIFKILVQMAIIIEQIDLIKWIYEISRIVLTLPQATFLMLTKRGRNISLVCFLVFSRFRLKGTHHKSRGSKTNWCIH